MDLPARGVLGFVLAVIALHAVAVARQGSRGRWIAAIVPVWAVCMIAWRVGLPPERIPIDLLVPLHEGTSDLSVKLLDMTSAHAGRRWRELVEGYAWVGLPDQRDAVHLDLGLLVLLLAWTGALVQRTVRSWGWTLGFVAVVALSPTVWMAALSETPAIVLALCAVQGAHAWRGWRVAAPWSAAGLLSALALLGDAVVAVAVRPEQGVLYAGPLAMIVWDLRFGRRDAQRRLHALGPRLADLVGGMLRHPRRLAAVVAATLAASAMATVVGSEPNWIVSAFSPFAPRLFTMVTWLGAVLPVVVGVGLALGLFGGVRQVARWGWLGLSFIALARMYHAAGNYVLLELLRYASLLLGPVLVLTVGAIGLLRAWSMRHAARYPRLAGALALWLALAPPSPVITDLFFRDFHGPTREDPVPGLVSTNKQREARFVFEVADRWADCVLVVPTAASSFRPHRDTQTGNDVHVRRPGNGVIRQPLREGTLTAWAAANLRPDDRCAVALMPMDCHQPAVTCPAVEGEVLATWTFEDDTWSNEAEFGAMPAAITLTAWRLR